MNNKQEKILDTVVNHERDNVVLSADKSRVLTFYGIKRSKYPQWVGWKFIDKNCLPNGRVEVDDDIETLVRRFYINQFYTPLRIDEAENAELAAHLLDFAVQTNLKTVVRTLRSILNEMSEGAVKRNGNADDEFFDTLHSVNQEELSELLIFHRNMYCEEKFPVKKECKKCKKRVTDTTRSVQPSIFLKFLQHARDKEWLKIIIEWVVSLIRGGRTQIDDTPTEGC